MLTSKELKERKSECLSHYENKTEIIVSMPVDDLIELIDNQEKLKKAIKILNNKRVNISMFKLFDNETQYNNLTNAFVYGGELTQEEYKLLKEVLGNDN